MYHWTLAKWKVVSSVFFDTAVVDNDKYVVIEGNNIIEKKEVDLSLNNLGIPKWMMSDGDKITAFEEKKTGAFSISAGTTRNTRGILFWSTPFVITKSNGEEVCVLVMDTQGLWDDETEEEFNCSIFGLSCLLSSYTIYNQKGNMNTDQLSKFSVLSQFSKDVSKDSGKPFQHLDLLMRDFEEYDLEGDKEITAGIQFSKERMEKMRKGRIEKEIVKKIEDCFSEFDLFCLPHPGMGVSGRKYDGTISKAAPLFMQMLSYYLKRIIGAIKCREIGGVTITGETFVKWDRFSIMMNRNATEQALMFMNQREFPKAEEVMDVVYLSYMDKLVGECAEVYKCY